MSTKTKHIYDLVGMLNYEAELHQTVTMEDRYHKKLMERSAICISTLEAQNKELRELLQDALPYVQQQAIKLLFDKALIGGG